MGENYSFFNSKEHDRKYNARNWADYFFPLFKSGVFNGSLQVVAVDGMRVKINPGYAWIDGYSYHLTDVGGLELNVETASGNMNRTDSVVIRLDLTNRWVKALYKAGSYYAGEPVPPAPEITATIHEIVIAHINVSAGKTEVTQDMIEDTRMDPVLCGWVCGAVQQITFEQIYEQFKAFQKNKENEIKGKVNEFEAWKSGFIEDQESELETKNRKWTEQFEALLGELEIFKTNATREFDGWLAGNTNNWEDEFYTWFGNLKEKLTENVAINLQSQIGNMSELKTEDKTSLTAAVNEVKDTLAETVEEVNGSLGEAVKDLVANMDSFAKSSIYADDHVSLGRKADTTVGKNSIAYGEDVEASGKSAQAFGIGTTARGEGQVVYGKYNEPDQNSKKAMIIGNGTAGTKRNIFEVDWNGNVNCEGAVNTKGGIILQGSDISATGNMNGAKYEYYLTKTMQLVEEGVLTSGNITIGLETGATYMLVTAESAQSTFNVYGLRARIYSTSLNRSVAPMMSNMCTTSNTGVTLGTVQSNSGDYGITLTAKANYTTNYWLYIIGMH